MASASLGGMKFMHEQGDLPIPGIVHVEQPYWFGSDQSLSPDELGLKAARSIEDKILELGADTVAAFIGEPIQDLEKHEPGASLADHEWVGDERGWHISNVVTR